MIRTARDRAKGRAAADRLRASGETDVVAETLDVSDPNTVVALGRTLAARGEHVDVLVNNTGILVGEPRGIVDTPLADLRATFETTCSAPFR